MDMDEIECIAANLIYRKYVKGYISHNLKVGKGELVGNWCLKQ